MLAVEGGGVGSNMDVEIIEDIVYIDSEVAVDASLVDEERGEVSWEEDCVAD